MTVQANLWTLSELAAALTLAGPPADDHVAITGVSIDSRTIASGELFVALTGDPGPRFQPTVRSTRDGHDFAAHAVRAGAAAVLVHRPGDYGVPALVVEDTLDALWQLGAAARRRLAGPVVAVTGSSGKTTFKSFAATALDAFATPGSLNNHLGVPLSLARTPRHAPAAVIEIGTNHPGEIAPLSRLAKPDVAVLLNVHPAHIGHFGSLDAIRREKMSIAEGLGEDGVLVRPVELEVEHTGHSLTFGQHAEADVELCDLRDDVARMRTPAGEVHCPVPGGGQHRAMSICALTAALIALGKPVAILERLAGEAPPRGRGNRIAVGGVTIVDESYNANPASMAATLAAFAKEPGRRIAVLGDMLELGAKSVRYHAELAEHCRDLDGVFCVGEHAQALYEALPESRRLGFSMRADAALASRCAAAMQEGDSMLVKGSNGIFWAARFVESLAAALDRRSPAHSTG